MRNWPDPQRRPWVGGALLLLALAACGEPQPPGETADAPLISFDTARVQVIGDADTLPLAVEVASTPDQRAVGLMERSSLAPEAGMVFLFAEDQPAEAGFWMFHTRIPLDIAYLDAEGRIVAIQGMEPCASPNPQFCPTYPPGVPYRAALEVNRGWFEAHGIGVGDRVLLPGGGTAGAAR